MTMFPPRHRRSLEKEVAALNAKLAKQGSGDVMQNAVNIGSLRVSSAKVNDVPKDTLRSMGDDIRSANADAVVLLADISGDSASLLCVCGADAVSAGADAGKIVRETAAVTGGKGGGKKDLAMAGVGDVSLIDKALEEFPSIVQKIIG